MQNHQKDCREQKNSVNRRLQAEDEATIKAPLVMSFSARMPAYAYTSLCSDPKLRKPPVRKKVQHET